MEKLSPSLRAAAVLTACFLTVLSAYGIRYSYGTLLPEMLSPLQMTKTQAGVIFSAYFIAYTLLSPVIGIMSDRFDVRILLSLFMLLMGMGTFLMQYAASQTQAAFFFTLAGAGCAACWAPVMALAQRWARPERRGLVLSLVDAGSTLGLMLAGTLIPMLVAGYGWRAGWRLLGAMALVLGVINFFCIRSRPEDVSAKASESGAQQPKPVIRYSALLKDARFWFIGMAYLLTGFSIIIPIAFITTYAVQELHLSYASAGFLVTLIGLGGLAGKLTLGPLSDKAGRIWILMLCAVLIAAGSLLIPFSRGIFLQLICFVFGMGYGACWAMYAACASDFFSRDAAGGIIGIWTLYLGIGSMIAPVLAGWSADLAGTLLWAFLMAGAGGAGSLLLLIPLLKTGGKDRVLQHKRSGSCFRKPDTPRGEI